VSEQAPPNAVETAPYERLARMIEHELELVGQGRFDELKAAVEHRGEVLAALPIPGPPAAGPVLERARLLHERLVIDTLRAREDLERSMAKLAQVRRAAQGYRVPTLPRYSTAV
jgi:hypothetical protein